AEIAEESGVEPHAVRIADNGTVLELTGEGLFVIGQIEAGMTLVDGYSVGDLRDEVLRDRRRLATDGVLIVVATIAAGVAEVVVDPEVIARGFDPHDDDGEEIVDAPGDAVEDVPTRCLANRKAARNLLQ